MGVERNIRIAEAATVYWPAIHSLLVKAGESPAMRMIDSELVFPDEEPPAGWQELRLALHGGMVTLRRTSQGVSCVTWGNADASLVRSWNLLAWAVASSAPGFVQHDGGELTSEAFAAREKLFSA